MQAYQHNWFASADKIPLTCSKVVCVGRNYAEHIEELGSAVPEQTVLFMKPPSAICDANQDLQLSHLNHLGEIHHELEISLLIGKPIDRQTTDIRSKILGIGLGIDLTLRDIQSKLKKSGLPWERAKAFDGSCVLSDFLRVRSEFDFCDVDFEFVVNRSVRQTANSKLMLTPIVQLLEQISQVFSLMPGDVVLTGTPAGVGSLKKGDEITASLNGQTLIQNIKIT